MTTALTAVLGLHLGLVGRTTMESAITRLLEDFENGRMTRRQLIQSLAMAAMTVPAASSAAAQSPAAPTSSPAPWKTVCLDYISYAVTDYKKSAAFYQSLMGWWIQDDNGTNQATLGIGSVGTILALQDV